MRNRSTLKTTAYLLLLVFTILQLPPAPTQTQTTNAGTNANQSYSATLPAPSKLSLQFQATPPNPTAELLSSFRTRPRSLRTPSSSSAGASSMMMASSVNAISPQVAPEGLSDFAFFTNTSLQVPITTAPTSLVNEPSFAQKNQLVFYTGNWYAARSINGGMNWSYSNPQSSMSDFCCDQDAIYNPSSGLFIWYRMGRPQTNLTNRFFLGVSTDASTWYIYKVYPTLINPSWTNQIFDFIIMAYSSNYLYVTNNVFQNQTYTTSLIMRLSLAGLKSHSSLTCSSSSSTCNFYTAKNDGFAPVQGAKTTMYFAAHQNTGGLTTSTLLLYVWNEASSTISSVYPISHTPYQATNPGDASCQAPDHGDICKRLDDRILGGWVSKGVIGFAWDVAQGSVACGLNYAYPYTYVIRINETLKANMNPLCSEPVIANPNYAWVYTWISPNARGDLGAVAFTAGLTRFPTLDVGILDSYSGATWQFEHVATSNFGPVTTCSTDSAHGYPCWGDFIRVRSFNGTSNAWVASGYTLQGGNTGEFVQPRYVIFGRLGDNPFNNATVTFLTLPSVVGSITFNGKTFKNGQSALYNVSTTYQARLNLPRYYNFSMWNATGGITVSNPLANPTNVTILGPGYLTGVMNPPNVTVNFFTLPSNIGSITCSGQTFTNGQAGQLPANSTIPCTGNPPVGYHFVAWSGLSNSTLSSIGLFTHNGGSLTAHFAVGPATSVSPFSTLTIGLLLGFILLFTRRRRKIRVSPYPPTPLRQTSFI